MELTPIEREELVKLIEWFLGNAEFTPFFEEVADLEVIESAGNKILNADLKS